MSEESRDRITERLNHTQPSSSAAVPESDVVLVPARPYVRDGRKDVLLEVRELADGRKVLPAFSDVAHLVDALGPHQPWIAMPLDAARALMAIARVHQVVLNPTMPPAEPTWTLQALENLTKETQE